MKLSADWEREHSVLLEFRGQEYTLSESLVAFLGVSCMILVAFVVSIWFIFTSAGFVIDKLSTVIAISSIAQVAKWSIGLYLLVVLSASLGKYILTGSAEPFFHLSIDLGSSDE